MGEKRKSNFELLRIISIFMIILFHCSWHGGIMESENLLGRITLDLFNQLGELGVNCFVLISGFFALKTKFKPQKLIELIAQVNFYAVAGILVLFIAADGELLALLKSWILPVTRGKYWFATAYILLYVFSPFLKILLENISQKDHKRLIVIMLFIWSVVPTLIGINGGMENKLFFNRFIWLVVVYIMGAYLSLYGNRYIRSKKQAGILMCSTVCVSLAFISIVEATGIGWMEGNYFWPPNSVLQVLGCIGLFSYFMHVNIPCSRIINYCASCTMGVYLLHDGILSSFIWKNVLQMNTKTASLGLIPYIVMAGVLIFVSGVAVDSIWKIIWKVMNRLYDRCVALVKQHY